VLGKLNRGFESHSLRHHRFPLIKRMFWQFATAARPSMEAKYYGNPFTDTNNLYSFGSVVLEVHGANGVAYFARGSVSVQKHRGPSPALAVRVQILWKILMGLFRKLLRALTPPICSASRSQGTAEPASVI
jgi:hypothetical protein